MLYSEKELERAKEQLQVAFPESRRNAQVRKIISHCLNAAVNRLERERPGISYQSSVDKIRILVYLTHRLIADQLNSSVLEEIAGRIRAFGGCIAIIGSGVSWEAGLPIDVYDLFLLCLREAGIDPEMNGGDMDKEEKLKKLLLPLEQDEDLMSRFKNAFTALVRKREVDISHKLLAMLFHTSIVHHILCFNWDDLLEQAHEGCGFGVCPSVTFGEQPSKDHIHHAVWHPHGNVRRPDLNWVLSTQKARLNSGLKEAIAHATVEPVPVLIIGYSESDPAISRLLFGRGGLFAPKKVWGEFIYRIRTDEECSLKERRAIMESAEALRCVCDILSQSAEPRIKRLEKRSPEIHKLYSSETMSGL